MVGEYVPCILLINPCPSAHDHEYFSRINPKRSILRLFSLVGDVNSDNDTDTESCLEDIREKFGIIEEHIMEEKSWWRRNKPRLWKLLDEPKSSKYAKVSMGKFY